MALKESKYVMHCAGQHLCCLDKCILSEKSIECPFALFCCLLFDRCMQLTRFDGSILERDEMTDPLEVV